MAVGESHGRSTPASRNKLLHSRAGISRQSLIHSSSKTNVLLETVDLASLASQEGGIGEGKQVFVSRTNERGWEEMNTHAGRPMPLGRSGPSPSSHCNQATAPAHAPGKGSWGGESS